MYHTLTKHVGKRNWTGATRRSTRRPGRAKELFSQDSAMDHFVIGVTNVPNDGSQRTRVQADPDDDDDE